MANSAWYRTWFDSRFYHILYKNRDQQEAAIFIDRLFKYLNPAEGSTFLDLACGIGRHSRTIADKGFEVVGVDLSKRNIKKAKSQSPNGPEFLVHDMRTPLPGRTFDFVLNLFTSFGYFETMAENERVLDAAFENLESKGKLVIDFLNAHQVIAGMVPEETIEDEGVRFDVTREVIDGIISKKIKVTDGNDTYDFEERVCALTKADFSGMLSRSGFEILDVFGSYHLDKFDPERSPRLILISRKRL